MEWSLRRQDGQADPSQLFQRAFQLYQRGVLDEADRLYRAVLAMQPDHVDSLRCLGFLQYERGHHAEARQFIGAALRTRPDDVAALSRFGAVLNALGDPEQALASYDRALALDPGFVDALNGRGNSLMQLGRPDEALASYDRAIALKPDHVPALSNRGVALRDLERHAEALESYDRALAIRPDHVWSLNNRGVALMDQKRPTEAMASFDKALALKPDYAEAHNNRGKALASYAAALEPGLGDIEALGGAPGDLMRPQEALASYDKAIALNPDYAEAHDNRGMLLFELGRMNEAADAIEHAIRLAPGRIRFYYHLMETRRFTPGDPHIAAMEAMAQDMTRLTADEQVELNFALAKALADAGDHTRSFRRLLDGAAPKRRRMVYDETAVLDVFERTRRAFTGQLMRRAEGLGDPPAVPVFIVGMPRSGTTLVEQILASHPMVFAAGETDAFNQAVKAQGVAADDPEATSRLSGKALRQIGVSYVDRLRAAAPDAKRIVNKRPDNFRFAGLIHLALPNARIIHLRRDPVDTCLSCFSKLFGDDLAYTFDLGELGRYYRAYETLMAHWRDVLPADVMLEVRYEDVVADLKGQARRILAHCGLEWDARCLDFHLTERRIRTASGAQVRRPIYGDSVGRWRAYEPFLGPLLDALGPNRSDPGPGAA